MLPVLPHLVLTVQVLQGYTLRAVLHTKTLRLREAEGEPSLEVAMSELAFEATLNHCT